MPRERRRPPVGGYWFPAGVTVGVRQPKQFAQNCAAFCATRPPTLGLLPFHYKKFILFGVVIKTCGARCLVRDGPSPAITGPDQEAPQGPPRPCGASFYVGLCGPDQRSPVNMVRAAEVRAGTYLPVLYNTAWTSISANWGPTTAHLSTLWYTHLQHGSCRAARLLP